MIRVVGDRVLVALPPRVDETVSAGGIVLVKDPDKLYTPSQGIVMQVGEKPGTVELDDVRTEIRSFIADQYGPGHRDVVRNVGDDVDQLLSTMTPAPFDVQEGDCVIFPRSAGEEIHQDGIDYVILRESDIIGIVEPLKVSA